MLGKLMLFLLYEPVKASHGRWESADYGKVQNMVVVGKQQEITNHGSGGKSGKVQIMVVVGKCRNKRLLIMAVVGKRRLWESTEYGCDGKAQIMGKRRIW